MLILPAIRGFAFNILLLLSIILGSKCNFATPEHDFSKRRNISLILYIIKYKNPLRNTGSW